MKKLWRILQLILFLIPLPLAARLTNGSIISFPNFQSKYVQSREIDVWLPPGYNTQNKYPVLYMQDGQMLFDSTKTWNHQAWEIDKTISELIHEGKINPCIVVGIWNNGKYRASEYFPQKALAFLSKDGKREMMSLMMDTSLADNYLKFIVKELKPFIDSNFSTLASQQNTFIAGSSFGGLIALYAVCEYPSVFYAAACLSTHWTGLFRVDHNPVPDAIISYLKFHLPNPVNHKFYFDHGTQTLDSMYGPIQKTVDLLFKRKGYTQKNFMSKIFPGADHSERSWEKRFYIPAIFFLGKS
jgi:enterochelin esterase-like enzyme